MKQHLEDLAEEYAKAVGKSRKTRLLLKQAYICGALMERHKQEKKNETKNKG
jgi:hypothetical protein